MVQKLEIFYHTIYVLALKLSKRDRFGIHSKIENLCLECLQMGLEATFETKAEKLPTLKNLRIKIEVLKRLLRIEYELKIIDNRNYWRLEGQLQEISKMANGWLKYVMQEPQN